MQDVELVGLLRAIETGSVIYFHTSAKHVRLFGQSKKRRKTSSRRRHSSLNSKADLPFINKALLAQSNQPSLEPDTP